MSAMPVVLPMNYFQYNTLPNAAECYGDAALTIDRMRAVEVVRPSLYDDFPTYFVAHQSLDGSTAQRLTSLAYLWNDIYSARTVADQMIAPTLTLRVEPITGEIDTQNRNAQANALMAMRNREATAQARVEEVLRELVEARERAELAERAAWELRTEQITDGGDSRLVEFWSIAEENATNANFCSEYDRMAEMMNGTRRESDYTVSGTVTVTFQFDQHVVARSADEATESIESYEFSEWREVMANSSSWNAEIDSIDVNGVSTD